MVQSAVYVNQTGVEKQGFDVCGFDFSVVSTTVEHGYSGLCLSGVYEVPSPITRADGLFRRISGAQGH